MINKPISPNHPTSFDIMKAIDVLIPFQSRLVRIHQAYLNGDSDNHQARTPWEVLTAYQTMDSYIQYDISRLSTKMYERVSCLKKYVVPKETESRIYELVDIEVSNNFEMWSLQDIYLFLQEIFKENPFQPNTKNTVVIENAIIQGFILKILEAFMIRF